MSEQLFWQSSLHDDLCVGGRVKTWRQIAGAEIAEEYSDEPESSSAFCFVDLSPLPRVGVIGSERPAGAEILAVNQVAWSDSGACTARLGESEWLCLANAAGEGLPTVAPVASLPRRDSHFCFGLYGACASEALARLCAIPSPVGDAVGQTVVAGIGSVLLPATPAGGAWYWLADMTVSVSAWQALQSLTADFSGGASGWRSWRQALAYT